MLKDETWTCYTRYYESSKRDSFKYNVRHDGIYAVLFLPEMPLEKFREEKYCGLFCRDKKLAFIVLFIGFPLLLFIFYTFFKMWVNKLLG